MGSNREKQNSDSEDGLCRLRARLIPTGRSLPIPNRTATAFRRLILTICLVASSLWLSPLTAAGDLPNPPLVLASSISRIQVEGFDWAGLRCVEPEPQTVESIATWYGGEDGFLLGDGMADGTPFNPDDASIAASNQWPLGTPLRVCHEARCIRVRVRDRGGFHHAVDLSRAAFASLAPLSSGVIDVRVEAFP